MKYFKVNGINYHCSDLFNYAAVDKNGSIYVYQNSPEIRLEKGYWSGGYKSQDVCVVQCDDFCCNWGHTLICL